MFTIRVSSMKKMCILAMGTFFLLSSSLTGCSSKISHSTFSVSYSDYSGVKEEEIHLNDGVNQLKMDGKISMKSGNVELYIKTIDTEQILYSESFNSENSGKISIDIDDLDNNLDLVLGLNIDGAEDFNLDLESKQKLTKDKEKPEHEDPEKPEVPSN